MIGTKMGGNNDRDEDRDNDGETGVDADGMAFCLFVRIVSRFIIVAIVVTIVVSAS